MADCGAHRPAGLDPELCRRIRASILLDETSVTATENIIMATVTASGTTAIRNAASEPHIQDLCQMLNVLGARIERLIER